MKKVKHAQDLSTTSLYLANIGSGGSWIRDRRGYGLAVGREKKPILGFLLRLFWRKYPAKIVRIMWPNIIYIMPLFLTNKYSVSCEIVQYFYDVRY